MSLKSFVNLLPRPVSDVAFQAYYSVTNKKVYNQSKKLAVRIALAAGIFFAAKRYNPALTYGVGTLLSLPATLLVAGGKAFFEGAKMMKANLPSRAFEEIGKGFGLAALGYFTLNKHNAFQFGLVETQLKKYAPAGKY